MCAFDRLFARIQLRELSILCGNRRVCGRIVGWFDENGRFQARGYVYEQTDRMKDPVEYLTPIREIEERAGLNFFPLLVDSIEDLIEEAETDDMWGAE